MTCGQTQGKSEHSAALPTVAKHLEESQESSRRTNKQSTVHTASFGKEGDCETGGWLLSHRGTCTVWLCFYEAPRAVLVTQTKGRWEVSGTKEGSYWSLSREMKGSGHTQWRWRYESVCGLSANRPFYHCERVSLCRTRGLCLSASKNTSYWCHDSDPLCPCFPVEF